MAKFVPKAKGLVSLNLGVSSSSFRIFAAMFWQVVKFVVMPARLLFKILSDFAVKGDTKRYISRAHLLCLVRIATSFTVIL